MEWKDHGGLVPVAGKQDRPARDRISILIDTDGDGRADRKEVFYEGLELVTGFVLHRDGVIAAAAPDIWLIRDTNGDGKADKVEKIYTGLGTSDTHAVINNLRWGFDGWIYATHGYSASDHVTSGDGSQDFGKISSGVVRFKPDGTAFEQYSSKGGNTWGLDIAWDNEVFFTQPTSGDLLNHVVMSEAALARGKSGNTPSYKAAIRNRKSNPLIKSENLAYVQIDLVGSFTASAGCAIYDGGTWPEDWRYSYFTTEPTINLIHHEVVKPDGVSFIANKIRDAEFIGGRDLWFRPIETRIGPDGALYLLDFYNQAVIHNDTRGPKHNGVNASVRPDRDHYFGRIWRVDHKQSKPLEAAHLDKASTEQLIDALDNPNRWHRMTAQRLLREQGTGRPNDPSQSKLIAALENKVKSGTFLPGRVQALWTVAALGQTSESLLRGAMADAEPALRKNALRVAAAGSDPKTGLRLESGIVVRLNDEDPRTQLEALTALASFPEVGKSTARTIVKMFPQFKDAWMESAAFAVAAKAPLLFSDLALRSPEAENYRSLVGFLSTQVATREDAKLLTDYVELLASVPSSESIRVALENLNKNSKTTPQWSSSLQGALERLLASTNSSVATASLPLIANWDKTGALSPRTSRVIEDQLKRLGDPSVPESQRADLAASLIAVQQLNPGILPGISKTLSSAESPTLKRRIIEALGATADARVNSVLVESFPALAPELQEAALNQILKRAEPSLALVEALKNGKINPDTLGPPGLHRLRTHSDVRVARQAGAVIDALRGPVTQEKNELIARLTPAVLQPGNAEAGKAAFAQNCAVCHKLNGEGKDLAPDLSGMGAHGPAELLVHVLDPNRVVEPNFVAYAVETKDDQLFDGIVARENRTALVLRSAAGEMEIRKENIKSQRNTGRSLMPEGFEALGGEVLRDVFAYMGAGEGRYRIIDLAPAFTASTLRGLYASAEATNDTLKFAKFGLIKQGDIPFDIQSPARTTNGNNVLVLRGGRGFSKLLPQRVTVQNIGVNARRLHFLGGVGGWAWPGAQKDLPVAKVVVRHANGENEEIILKNGVEIADYAGNQDVPGSEAAPALVSSGQIRTFSKTVRDNSPIDSITLESFDNGVAPTFVAITAETTAPNAALGSKSSAPGIPTLIVGGGSSHDFTRWFNEADRAILAEKNLANARYTEDTDSVTSALADIRVLYLSNNKPFKNPAARDAIMAFANAGKGLVLVHPALWYNWAEWPEYNSLLVGGGARSHDKYGEFEVTIDDPAHPVTQGVPATFRISDELYHVQKDEKGSEIQVLATGKNLATGKTYPVLWITKHPKARIVCITLGHDGKAHEHPAYRKLLQNSVAWADRGPRP